MLWTVARIEIKNLLAETSVWLVAVLLAVAVAYAAWTGSRAVAVDRQSITSALAQQDSRLKALHAAMLRREAIGEAVQAGDDPGDPALVGRELAAQLAILPLSPLAAVAVGQRDLASGSVRITTDGPQGRSSSGEAALAGPTRLMTGAFDLAFVFMSLLPLVIIVLTYDLLSSERERGTLALVLAQPVSLATFVLGKALLRGVLLCGVTVALAVLAALPSAHDLLTADGALHMGLYLAAVVGYALFWFAAALAINVAGFSSATNALALVGLWLALVVVVPGMVQVAVQVAHPPPSRVELVNLTRAAASEIEDELSALQGEHTAAVQGTADDLALAATKRIVVAQEALEHRAAPVLIAFRTQLTAQQALLDTLRYLSPAIVVHEAMGEVAGSGAHRLQQFASQVDAFQANWRAFFFARVRAHQRLTSADHAALPRFVFREEPSAALGWRVGAGLLGLLVPTLLLVAFAAIVLRRSSRPA